MIFVKGKNERENGAYHDLGLHTRTTHWAGNGFVAVSLCLNVSYQTFFVKIVLTLGGTAPLIFNFGIVANGTHIGGLFRLFQRHFIIKTVAT